MSFAETQSFSHLKFRLIIAIVSISRDCCSVGVKTVFPFSAKKLPHVCLIVTKVSDWSLSALQRAANLQQWGYRPGLVTIHHKSALPPWSRAVLEGPPTSKDTPRLVF